MSISATSMSASLADPSGSSPLGAAVDWLLQTMTGSIATAVAILAISSVGLMMLNGRIGVRRGGTVVAGCFLLFGASAMASGIQSFLADSTDRVAPAELAPPPAPPPPPAAPPVNADPYAGASVPTG